MCQRLREGCLETGKEQARGLVFGSGQDEERQTLGLRSVQSDQVEKITGRADEQGIGARGAQAFPNPLAARRVIKWLVLHGDFQPFNRGGSRGRSACRRFPW